MLIACASLVGSCAPKSPRPQELLRALAGGELPLSAALILRDDSTPSGMERWFHGATIGALYVDSDAATVIAHVAPELWNAVPPELQAAWLERMDLVPDAAQDELSFRFHFLRQDDIWKLDLRRPTVPRN